MPAFDSSIPNTSHRPLWSSSVAHPMLGQEWCDENDTLSNRKNRECNPGPFFLILGFPDWVSLIPGNDILLLKIISVSGLSSGHINVSFISISIPYLSYNNFTFTSVLVIDAPQLQFWGIWPLKWGDISTEPPKDTSLHGKTSHNVLIVKFGPPVRPVHVPMRPKKTKKETLQWQTGYSPRPPTSSDQNTVWHGWWSTGSSY